MVPASSSNYQASLGRAQQRSQSLAPNGTDLDRPGARSATGRGLVQPQGAPTPLQPQGEGLGAFHSLPSGHPLRHMFAGMGAQLADQLHPAANGGAPAPANSVAQQMLTLAHGSPQLGGNLNPQSALGPGMGSDRLRQTFAQSVLGSPLAQTPPHGGFTDGQAGGGPGVALGAPVSPTGTGNATGILPGRNGVVTPGGISSLSGAPVSGVPDGAGVLPGRTGGVMPGAMSGGGPALLSPRSAAAAAAGGSSDAAAGGGPGAASSARKAAASGGAKADQSTTDANNQSYADLIQNMLKGKGRNAMGTRRALMQLMAGNAFRANGPLWDTIAQLEKQAAPGYYDDGQRAAEMAPVMQTIDDKTAQARSALIKDLAGRGIDQSSGAANAFATLDAQNAGLRSNAVANLYQQEQQRQLASQQELLSLLSGMQGRNADQASNLANSITQFKLQQEQIDAANNPMNLLNGLFSAGGQLGAAVLRG